MYRYTASGAILRESDGAHIPCDEANRDYRAILSSGAEVAPYVAPTKPSKRLTLEQLEDLVVYMLLGPEPTPQPAPVVEPDPPADGIPEEFRSLRLADESPEKFTERMKRRWQALKHLQIDGSKPTNSRALPDMTEEEVAELADLTARNNTAHWLD